MRAFFLFFVLVVVPKAGVLSQTNAMVWFKHPAGGSTTVIPWVISNHGSLMVDARYNFDALNTLSVFGGVSKQVGIVTFTPALGFMAGKYGAVSAELYASAQIGETSFFLMNQYTWGGGSYDFHYHWAEAMFHPSKHFGIGLDGHLYQDTRDHVNYIDAGPVAKVLVGDVYAKLWLTESPTRGEPFKARLGLGWTPH